MQSRKINWRTIFEPWLNLGNWLPCQCWQCIDGLQGGLEGPFTNLLCYSCEVNLPWIRTHCLRCAQPTLNPSQFGCSVCKNYPYWHLDECHSALRYEESIREWIIGFKFFQQTKLRKLLRTLFLEGVVNQEVELTGQLISVPPFRKPFAPATVQSGSITGTENSATHLHCEPTKDQPDYTKNPRIQSSDHLGH